MEVHPEISYIGSKSRLDTQEGFFPNETNMNLQWPLKSIDSPDVNDKVTLAKNLNINETLDRQAQK